MLVAVVLTASVAPRQARAESLIVGHENIGETATSCLVCHGRDSLKINGFLVPLIAKQQARYLLNSMLDYRRGVRSSNVMRAQLQPLRLKDLRDLATYFADEHPNQDAASVRALGGGGGADAASIPPKVSALCGSCHGETGGGVLPEIPSLAGQNTQYLNQALHEYQLGVRKNATMTPLVRHLSKLEIRQLSDYFGAQTQRPFSVRSQVRDRAGGEYADTIAISEHSPAPIHYKSYLEIIRELAMVDVPGGSFEMGDDESEGFTVGSPKHTVHIHAFRIGKTEVTFEQYDAFTADTHRGLANDEGWGRGNRPVINITGSETQAFIAWLSRKSGRHFRLPSEAEWEYAARGGTTTVYWWGDDFNPQNLNALGTNDRDRWIYTAPVGEFPANPFGLFDTSGNVAERVADCWHHRYIGAPTDGRAWLATPCYTRVSRGGSWNLAKRPMRSSARAGTSDSIRSMALGFRVAEDFSQ